MKARPGKPGQNREIRMKPKAPATSSAKAKASPVAPTSPRVGQAKRPAVGNKPTTPAKIAKPATAKTPSVAVAAASPIQAAQAQPTQSQEEKTSPASATVFTAGIRAAIQGDPEAAWKLLEMARYLCSEVETFRQAQPALAKKIARPLPDWPIVAGRHRASLKHIKRILAELELAEDHQARAILVPQGKGPDLDGDINNFASQLWEVLNFIRRLEPGAHPASLELHKLPEFTRDKFDQWWDLGWSYFLKVNGGKPFNDPRLKAASEVKNKRGECRLEMIVNKEGVSTESRIETEVRKAAMRLWPRLAGVR